MNRDYIIQFTRSTEFTHATAVRFDRSSCLPRMKVLSVRTSRLPFRNFSERVNFNIRTDLNYSNYKLSLKNLQCIFMCTYRVRIKFSLEICRSKTLDSRLITRERAANYFVEQSLDLCALRAARYFLDLTSPARIGFRARWCTCRPDTREIMGNAIYPHLRRRCWEIKHHHGLRRRGR